MPFSANALFCAAGRGMVSGNDLWEYHPDAMAFMDRTIQIHIDIGTAWRRGELLWIVRSILDGALFGGRWEIMLQPT